jgi:hypothetical protein
VLSNTSILLGVGYKMQSGKDTMADYCVDKYSAVKVSFASKLKELVSDLYGIPMWHLEDIDFKNKPIDRLDGQSPRDIMQKLGHSIRQIKNSSLIIFWTGVFPGCHIVQLLL